MRAKTALVHRSAGATEGLLIPVALAPRRSSLHPKKARKLLARMGFSPLI
ncbi:hypothetical protein [Corynebacterium sp. CCM 9203]